MASWDRKSGGWSLVNNPYDVEAADYGSEWDNAEKDVRNGFVRKVFGILSVQLLITAGACSLFILNDGVKSFVGQNPWLLFTAFFGVLALLCTFACNPQVARTYPGNYIFLSIFTVLEAFMVGIISASYNTDVVLMAAGVTCFIVIGLTLFALQTKYDFTTCGGILLSLLLTVFLGSILLAFLPHNKIANIAYGCIGAMLFSMYLVFDIQLMMAGKKVQISPDDYVFAAINLYLDVINIFLHLLRVFSELQN